MKLITEAAGDDQFNAHMDKIQQAIVKLENLMASDFVPVGSQVNMVELASSDLAKIAKSMIDKRK